MTRNGMVLAIAVTVLLLMLLAASVTWPACCDCQYDAQDVLRCK